MHFQFFGCIFLLWVHSIVAAPAVQFFMYPLPVPGRAMSASSTNSIMVSPYQNFHFQVKNPHDGSYHFGYDADKSYREEKRDSFGVVTGRYGYLDPDGVHRMVEYIADHNGYRTRSTNQFYLEPTPVVTPVQAQSAIQVIGPIPKPSNSFY